MQDVRLDSRPDMAEPTMIVAFRGWNDAGAAATHAVEYLIGEWSAERFGAMDPELYYDFTQARPHTRPVGEYRRELTWPVNDLYYARHSSGRDIVLMLGTEPHLRWRRYGENLLDLVTELGVGEVLTLGALLADTPHTVPVPLSGGSGTPDLSARLGRAGIQGSRYEGPTGIVGVLGWMLSNAGIANGSIWAAVPHYISATPNPKASVALLRQLAPILGLRIALDDLEAQARTYEQQVDSAIAASPEAQQYVRDLELQNMASPEEPGLDLPPREPGEDPWADTQAEGLIQSVEEFLRRKSDQEGEDARG